MNDKGKTTILIYISILVILGVIFVAYKEMSVQKIYIPERKEEIEKGKEISKEDTRIVDAYQKIYKKTLNGKDRTDNFYVYRNSKVNFDNIDDLYVYLAVTSKMNQDNVKKIVLPPSNVETYMIDVNAFNRQLIDLYGNAKYTLARRLDESDLKVVNGLGYSCNSITKDSIQCDTVAEKKEPKDRIYGYIDKVEESDHYIYIYEKEIYIETVGDNSFKNVNIYTGVESLLASGINIETDIAKLNRYEISEEELVKKIENDYSRLSIYKHTFKKLENNNLIWVSTEPAT